MGRHRTLPSDVGVSTNTVRLRCNDCGATRQGKHGESVTGLRVRLAEVSWASYTDTDVDLCPTCLDKRVAERAFGGDSA